MSEHFFGSNMQANFIVIGAAFQSGCIPISSESIEKAIEMNVVAVSQNTNAFNIGRKVVSDPHWIDTIDLYRSGSLASKPILSSESSGKCSQSSKCSKAVSPPTTFSSSSLDIKIQSVVSRT